jgi:hypothetical protein
VLSARYQGHTREMKQQIYVPVQGGGHDDRSHDDGKDSIPGSWEQDMDLVLTTSSDCKFKISQMTL